MTKVIDRWTVIRWIYGLGLNTEGSLRWTLVLLGLLVVCPMLFCFVASLINLIEQKDVAPLETGTKSINIEKTINWRMLDVASHAATAFGSKKFINVYQNFLDVNFCPTKFYECIWIWTHTFDIHLSAIVYVRFVTLLCCVQLSKKYNCFSSIWTLKCLGLLQLYVNTIIISVWVFGYRTSIFIKYTKHLSC